MKHILVVDFKATNLESAMQALKDNFMVTALTSEKESLDFLDDHHIDLILLDFHLKVSNGYEIITKLKTNSGTAGIPILFITEQNDRESALKGIELGADDFIATPFAPEILVSRVNTFLELYEYRSRSAMIEHFQDAIAVSFAELVEYRDETTGGHIKNTTLYFKILLDEVVKHKEYQKVLPPEDVKELLRSAPLHDIGKIGITDDILRKSSTLDTHEFEYMKTHTILGEATFDKIIAETGGTRFLYLAKDLAFCHHERWDGTGYPRGLKGEEIPLHARILTIADVYDALTSKRSYKEAFSHEKAKEIIIEGKGSFFDPNLIPIFIESSDRLKEALLMKNQNS